MTPNQMRQAVILVYPGKKWETKVGKMSDEQVVAIFRRLQNQGKINL